MNIKAQVRQNITTVHKDFQKVRIQQTKKPRFTSGEKYYVSLSILNHNAAISMMR